MYCFCVEKTVVHVPIGGVLKDMVILSSTGEWIVVNLESTLLGGKDCPSTDCVQRNKTLEVSVAGKTSQKRWCRRNRSAQPI